MKTVIQPFKKMSRRKPLTAAALLILVMNIFRCHTLRCHQVQYLIGNECCYMCLPGSRVKTDCTEFRSTSCVPCIPGRTYMNQPTGLKECFFCTNCDAGSGLKTKTSCTTTSDTVCEPQEGFYCVDSTEGSCVSAEKHTSCQPGQYISQNGTASSDTVCSDCSGGTFSDGSFTSCQPHTQCESIHLQLLKPGTVSMDAECGEQSSDMTGVVIGVVVLLFLLIGIISVMYYLKKKKKGCLNTERIKANKEITKWFTKKERRSGEGEEMM